MRTRTLLGLPWTLLVAACFAAACSQPQVIPCGEIPRDGCPLGRGGTCDDATCDALYDCVDGAWARVTQCAGDGGGGSSDGGGGQGGEGGATCTPVVIDHTGQTQGCAPDLQQPDCPVEAAETCVETACLNRCSDFFICLEAGWTAVAYCTEEGTLVLEP